MVYMKKNPPGLLIKKHLDRFQLSVTDAAKILKLARPHFSDLINGKSSITPEMAIRLEKVFGTDAKTWLLLQLDYDLAVAKKEFKEKGIRLRRMKVFNKNF